MKKQSKFICSMIAILVGAALTLTQTSCNSDPCSGLICKNGGTCAKGICDCPAGYTGPKCDTAYSKQFVGTYPGTDAASAGSPATLDTVIITADSVNGAYAIIINAVHYGIKFNASVQNNSIAILPQSVVINSVTTDSVSNGSGTFTLPIATINYTLKGTASDTIKFTGVKQ